MKNSFLKKYYIFAVIIMLLAKTNSVVNAQIGGKNAADSPVVLEDMEDLDLTANGLMRAWIPDAVQGEAQPLKAITLSTSGLTLAPEQTPIGALEFTVPSSFSYVQSGFGVPMPAVAGASTATSPGNIAQFTNLHFNASYQPSLNGTKFNVILQTYPANTSTNPPTYPQIFWQYSIPAGTTFQQVNLDLYAPTLIEGAGSLTLAQLLSQTRFLYFFCYAGPLTVPDTLRFRLDDVTLSVDRTPASINWSQLE
jgi:hypothetical protein